MTNLLVRHPSKRQTAGCAVLIVLGLILFGCLVWFGPRLVMGPSVWKKIIGKVRVPERGTLCLGRSHDGDISYEYFVRVSGAGDDLGQWHHLAYSLNPVEDSVTALTSDLRYAAISFASDQGDVVAVYDSVTQELWWNSEDQWTSTSRFLTAWRLLHAKNPRLSAPP